MQKENSNGKQEMSFSGKIKEELARQWSEARHCQIAELAAIISMCGKVSIGWSRRDIRGIFGFQKFAVTAELLQESVYQRSFFRSRLHEQSGERIPFGDRMHVRKESGTTAIGNACI